MSEMLPNVQFKFQSDSSRRWSFEHKVFKYQISQMKLEKLTHELGFSLKIWFIETFLDKKFSWNDQEVDVDERGL